MKTFALLICLSAVVALSCAAPARIGSGVNLAGMEFGSAKPGTFNTDYTLPTTAEVRSKSF